MAQRLRVQMMTKPESDCRQSRQTPCPGGRYMLLKQKLIQWAETKKRKTFINIIRELVGLFIYWLTLESKLNQIFFSRLDLCFCKINVIVYKSDLFVYKWLTIRLLLVTDQCPEPRTGRSGRHRAERRPELGSSLQAADMTGSWNKELILAGQERREHTWSDQSDIIAIFHPSLPPDSPTAPGPAWSLMSPTGQVRAGAGGVRTA